MRHRMGLKKIARDSSHRRALLANLSVALFKHEQIRTTIAKARALRPVAEKLITLGKRGKLHSRRRAAGFLQDEVIAKKLFDVLGKRFMERAGGYTRIVKTNPRRGDMAEMAIIELLDRDVSAKGTDSGPTREEAEKRRKEEAEKEQQ